MKSLKGILAVWISTCLLGGCTNRAEQLMSEGDQLVRRIEVYRKKSGVLPPSLAAMGIAEVEEGPLYYQPKRDTAYVVWFGTTLGESMTYHSDTRQWQAKQREEQ